MWIWEELVDGDDPGECEGSEELVMILRDVRVWEGDDPEGIWIWEGLVMIQRDVRIWEGLVDKYDPGDVDLGRAGDDPEGLVMIPRGCEDLGEQEMIQGIWIWEGQIGGDDPEGCEDLEGLVMDQGDVRIWEELMAGDDPKGIWIWEELVDKSDPGDVDLGMAGGWR
ncbi:hypothetical protein HGM15179_019064 [Zosterops borbonicus]|uniref:Uncharacterized protein n=1 Tax=Zosterops borbonicus TaxID=364589 RepID=A0A8K1FYR0_9PASS|nr:hypothetical protein HGM15179_019064 [Zosterops borbonicus]